jgi:hypothetical protein
MECFHLQAYDLSTSIRSLHHGITHDTHATLQAMFILFESASGFALFNVHGIDEIGQAVDKVQESIR